MEDDDLVDDEIIEIFIEEGGEVLETINEFFPQWVSDHENNAARIEVRRAFHTLKGSGRMVQAYEIGELAWSIENMLNRVIDGTVKASGSMFEIIKQVLDILPGMLDLFAHGKEQELNVEPLIHAAEALAKGLHPTVNHALAEKLESEEAELVALCEDESSHMEFQKLVSHQLAELSKTVHQLSMAVKGINQEISNVKTLIRAMDNKVGKGGEISEMKLELAATKQDCERLNDELQRTTTAVNQRISTADKDIKSQFGKMGRQIENMNGSLTKATNKMNGALNEVNTSIKGYAFGAAVFAIVFALIVDMFQHS